MAERLTLDQIAQKIMDMNPQALHDLVERRVQNIPTVLPALSRDEDPADIFIDCIERFPTTAIRLASASTAVMNEWATKTNQQVQDAAEAMGELLYLCGRVGAKDAMPAISELARREDLDNIKLGNGEDIQLRALRSLGGLLYNATAEEREGQKELFEKALDTPVKERMLIGLNTLYVFWPEQRDSFIERARRHPMPNIEELVKVPSFIYSDPS